MASISIDTYVRTLQETYNPINRNWSPCGFSNSIEGNSPPNSEVRKFINSHKRETFPARSNYAGRFMSGYGHSGRIIIALGSIDTCAQTVQEKTERNGPKWSTGGLIFSLGLKLLKSESRKIRNP